MTNVNDFGNVGGPEIVNQDVTRRSLRPSFVTAIRHHPHLEDVDDLRQRRARIAAVLVNHICALKNYVMAIPGWAKRKNSGCLTLLVGRWVE